MGKIYNENVERRKMAKDESEKYTFKPDIKQSRMYFEHHKSGHLTFREEIKESVKLGARVTTQKTKVPPSRNKLSIKANTVSRATATKEEKTKKQTSKSRKKKKVANKVTLEDDNGLIEEVLDLRMGFRNAES